jgi:hypothetical protein
MQDNINQIVEGFLSGDQSEEDQAEDLYKETFDLDEIQSEAIRCGTILPNWFLEFDRDNLELLEESLPPERMKELESGAEPTPEERESYRALRLSQVENGGGDADVIPGFWIHQIRDSNGIDLFALTTVIGYSFSLISSEFHGLFLSEEESIKYLKQDGVVIDG